MTSALRAAWADLTGAVACDENIQVGARPGQGGWPGVPHYATYPAAYYPPTGVAFTPPMAPFSSTPAGGQGWCRWSGYAGPVTSAPPAAAVLPPPTSSPPVLRPAIKHEAA